MERIVMQGIDTNSSANAACLEHQILDHVKQALRVTLDWKVPTVGVARKLSSVQFTLKSFQRHLERMMILEEQDGYMTLVAELKPNMSFRVERLALDHGRFRDSFLRLLPEVEALCEYQNEDFEEVCREIYALLDSVDRHDEEEVKLLQETFLCDEGGEG
jgi:hypothetical protein